MSDKEKILNFINRRFPEDSHWTNGNCYWFAKILADEFDMEVFYLPIEGHFVAGWDAENNFYDHNGVVKIEEDAYALRQIKWTDPLWYKRLMRDCRD